MSPIVLDPLDPAFDADPYPLWHRLRETDPVWWWEAGAAWVVTGYTEVRAGISTPWLTPDRRLGAPAAIERDPQGPFELFAEGSPFAIDGPDHLRLRRLVAEAFTPRSVANEQHFLERSVDELLGEAGAGDVPFDAVASFAAPLGAGVLRHHLGLDLDDQFALDLVVSDIGPSANPRATTREVARARSAARTLTRLLTREADDRRARPRNDLLSRLVHAHDGVLTTREVVGITTALVVAGAETTVHAISGSLLCLLDHPDQRALVLDDPDRVGAAVSEVLRYAHPAKFAVRYATGAGELGSHHVERGQLVLLSLAAALRDPAVFPDPDRFDITRTDAESIAFGLGPHYCVGAALARLTTAVAVGRTLEQLPELRPGGQPTWLRSFLVRGLRSLPLRA